MRLSRSKLYDLAMAAPLVGFYGWILVDTAMGFPARWANGAGLLDTMRLVSDALSVVLLSLVMVLFVVRRVPIAKLPGTAPRLTAFLGTFATFLLYELPFNLGMSVTMYIVSMVLIFVGVCGTIYAFAHLGRQVSIMPEARKLVTSGPYSFVRHPAYLFEQIGFLGVALQHEQPVALLLYAAQTILQVCRTFYEERVLSASFREYADYAARTPRLLPFTLRQRPPQSPSAKVL
jgi:protein-S-isoprenylcysteine O-methyltransferase Ste14